MRTKWDNVKILGYPMLTRMREVLLMTLVRTSYMEGPLIRSEEGFRGIAGDVIVGWIKARSGKGGVDDYFLASDHQRCPDDAESCPDTSQGPFTYTTSKTFGLISEFPDSSLRRHSSNP